MLDDGRPLEVMVPGGEGRFAEGGEGARTRADGEATLLPLYLESDNQAVPRRA